MEVIGKNVEIIVSLNTGVSTGASICGGFNALATTVSGIMKITGTIEKETNRFMVLSNVSVVSVPIELLTEKKKIEETKTYKEIYVNIDNIVSIAII